MSDGEFLFGRALSDRIRQICAEDEVDCAVAFWGRSIRDDLFPRWETQRVRIICDISMGCNSRRSLMRFGAPTDDPECVRLPKDALRVRDGLHAKVYISGAGAVVGSANASGHGVGTKARDAEHLEAGVFFAAGTTGWHDATHFFQNCFDNAAPLDSKQLERAPLRASEPIRHIAEAGPGSPLLDLVSSYPEEFGDVLFIAEWEAIEREAEEESTERYEAYQSANPDDDVERELIVRCPADYLPFKPGSAIMFWRKTLIGYQSIVDVSSGEDVTLWGESGWRAFWSHRRFSRPSVKPTAAELEFIQSINGGQWAMTARELAEEWRSYNAA